MVKKSWTQSFFSERNRHLCLIYVYFDRFWVVWKWPMMTWDTSWQMVMPSGVESASQEGWGSRSGSLNHRDTRSLLSVYSTSLRVLTSPGRGLSQRNCTILRFLRLNLGDSNLNFGTKLVSLKRLEAELRDAKVWCKKAGLSRFSASGIDICV